MSLGSYLKSHVGDMLLVFVSAWCMAQVGFNAFYIDDVQHGFIVPVAVAVLVLALFMAGYRKSTVLVGGAAVAVLALAFVCACVALSVNEGGMNADEEGNYLYFALVIVMCAVVCFLLTRRLVGSVVWFIAVAFACSCVQAFYVFDEYVFSIVASASALVMVLYRNFTLGLVNAQTLGKMTHLKAFVSAAVPVVCCLAVALVAWFGVIAPMNPGVFEIKLITDYRHLPFDEFKGTAAENPVYDTSLTTQNLVDGERYTTDDLYTTPTASDEIDAKSVLDKQQTQSTGSEGGGDAAGTESSLDRSSTEQVFDAHSYSDNLPWWVLSVVLVLLLVAAVVAYFVLRRRWRRERLLRMLAGAPEQQLARLYLFCLGRMKRIGFRLPRGLTIGEFAHSSERRMDAFTVEAGVTFGALTKAYEECCAYGKRSATMDDVALGVAFYEGFWRAARTYLGNFKYFCRSFRL